MSALLSCWYEWVPSWLSVCVTAWLVFIAHGMQKTLSDRDFRRGRAVQLCGDIRRVSKRIQEGAAIHYVNPRQAGAPCEVHARILIDFTNLGALAGDLRHLMRGSGTKSSVSVVNCYFELKEEVTGEGFYGGWDPTVDEAKAKLDRIASRASKLHSAVRLVERRF